MGHRNTSREKARRRARHNWAISIERNPDILGGSPVFPGTRLSVEHIGEAMLRGNAREVAELKRDYPYLRENDFEMAKHWFRRIEARRAQAKQRLQVGQTYQINAVFFVPAVELKITIRATRTASGRVEDL